MEVGFHLPSAQPAADADGILGVAKTVERLGFDSVWMFDHLFTPTGLESQYPYSRDGSYPMSPDDPFFDPLALFGVLAGATTKIKIGSVVMIAAYRHPLVLGKAIASIERFAPGRLVLGLGAGWMREEFDALEVPFERRGARFTEYLQALRTVWSGDPAGFDGEFYSWPEAGFLPAPTAPVPLIVGGHTDAALRRAVRHADGWAIAFRKEDGRGLAALEKRLSDLDRILEEEGRTREDFQLVYQDALWFSDHVKESLPLTGPADAIASSMARLKELGVTMVDLLVIGPASLISENAERFAEEVRAGL
ncbi:MAG TPA: TIGR03619 family F420-dependent LLM class oxidoreductase [Actinomycetota bacterium]|nr:TIGR03619 family F420-dependent LLM class oxidoreductase [Actinomycetota bacterium]